MRNNGSMTKRLLTIMTLLFACFAVDAWAKDSVLPEMGSSSGQTMTTAQERELGGLIMQDVYRFLPVNQDPYLEQYIQQLGQILVNNSPDSTGQYHFFILNDSTINAFALPGGYIGVHSGLILQTRNESELAAVLAHEISHVSQHHIARMFEKADQMSLPTMAAVLGSMAVAAANPQLGSGLLAGTMAAQQQTAINFTRHNEQEADSVGIDILAKSDFDPNAMESFFKRMGEVNQYNDNGSFPEFLRTHPISQNRMADAAARAAHYTSVKARPDEYYKLIKERLRVDTGRPQPLKAYYEKQPNTFYNRYGMGVLALELRAYPEGYSALEPLLKARPDNVLFAMGQARILMGMNQQQQGLALAASMNHNYPNNLAVVLDLADLYLKAGYALKAKDLLKQYIKFNHPSPEVFNELARAYDNLNQKKAAYQALADYYIARQQYELAMIQLLQAKKTPPINAYQNAMLDDKISYTEEMIEHQKKMIALYR